MLKEISEETALIHFLQVFICFEKEREREREREREHGREHTTVQAGRGREREREREKSQAGSELSAQSPTWGLNPRTVSSRPELKPRVGS